MTPIFFSWGLRDLRAEFGSAVARLPVAANSSARDRTFWSSGGYIAQQNHWSERGRATTVAHADALGRPRRSALSFDDEGANCGPLVFAGAGCWRV